MSPLTDELLKLTVDERLRLIETLWPTGYVTPAEDYELWLDSTPENDGHIAAGYLTQVKPYCIPFKSAEKAHFEPFLGVLRHLSNLAAIGEGAAIQWTVRTADPRRLSGRAESPDQSAGLPGRGRGAIPLPAPMGSGPGLQPDH